MLDSLSALIELTRGVPGCRACRLMADINDTSVLLLATEWSDANAASAYFASPGFQVFRGLRVLFRGQPWIVLDEVSRRITRPLRSY